MLRGEVGSRAYGLAGPSSDIDRMGLYSWRTERLFELRQPAAYYQADADTKWFEVRKYAELALGGNPTVMELMWLPEYEVASALGRELIGIRSAFLSAHRVRSAYLGYATQQFTKLERRGGTFSSDLGKRTAKHARHLLRLCQQGFSLYATGELAIRVPEPEKVMEFGERVAAGDIELARGMMARYEQMFDDVATVLPSQPDKKRVDQWLRLVRMVHLEDPWEGM